MNKTNLKIILTITILFYSAKSFSQTTTTILYDTSSHLSTTKCNVFDPPVNVGGKLHTGVIGGATFSTTNGLTLPTTYTFSSSQTKRTDYRISYPFKSGYTYRIEFTAFGDVSNSTAYPSLGASLFTAAGLTLTSTSCGAVYNNDFPEFGSVLITQLNGTSATYSPSTANFTSPSNFDYLVLEATCRAAQNITANVYIQKIKIIETPPVSFSLTQSASSISCGSTTPITFTVNNLNNTSNITGYTWDLGTAPNGWLLPNGTPAPATYSTGITNTLTLTPVCGSVQKNVSATVTANGNNYNTNASTVSITQPTLSINGSGAICSGSSNYSVTGLPCNASVTWSITPATGIANLSCSSCATTSLSYVSNGTVTLTATVSNVCGTSINVTKQNIIVGTPQYTYEIVPLPISSYTTCYKLNTTYSFTLQPTGTDPYFQSNGTYQWFLTGTGVLPSTGKTVSFQFTQAGDFTLTARPNNACGLGPVSTYSETLHAALSCPRGSFISVSPNPVSSYLNIETIAASNDNSSLTEKSNITGFDRVEVFDKTGNIVLRKSYPLNTKKVNLNVSILRSDVYVVRIFNGNISEEHKIIVQH